MTLLIVTSLLFAVRVSRTWRLSDFALSGAFAGLATATKYNAGLVILGVIAAAATATTSQAQPRRKINPRENS